MPLHSESTQSRGTTSCQLTVIPQATPSVTTGAHKRQRPDDIADLDPKRRCNPSSATATTLGHQLINTSAVAIRPPTLGDHEHHDTIGILPAVTALVETDIDALVALLPPVSKNVHNRWHQATVLIQALHDSSHLHLLFPLIQRRSDDKSTAKKNTANINKWWFAHRKEVLSHVPQKHKDAMATKHVIHSAEKHAELRTSMGAAAYRGHINQLDNESCVNFKCVVQKALWQSPLFRDLISRRVCVALGLAIAYVLAMDAGPDPTEVESLRPLLQLLLGDTSAVTHRLPSAHKSSDIMTDTELQPTSRFASAQMSAYSSGLHPIVPCDHICCIAESVASLTWPQNMPHIISLTHRPF